MRLSAAVTAGGVTCKFFGEASADGLVLVLREFPDRLQVVFA